jgi:hypothetical protein
MARKPSLHVTTSPTIVIREHVEWTNTYTDFHLQRNHRQNRLVVVVVMLNLLGRHSGGRSQKALSVVQEQAQHLRVPLRLLTELRQQLHSPRPLSFPAAPSSEPDLPALGVRPNGESVSPCPPPSTAAPSSGNSETDLPAARVPANGQAVAKPHLRRGRPPKIPYPLPALLAVPDATPSGAEALEQGGGGKIVGKSRGVLPGTPTAETGEKRPTERVPSSIDIGERRVDDDASAALLLEGEEAKSGEQVSPGSCVQDGGTPFPFSMAAFCLEPAVG